MERLNGIEIESFLSALSYSLDYRDLKIEETYFGRILGWADYDADTLGSLLDYLVGLLTGHGRVLIMRRIHDDLVETYPHFFEQYFAAIFAPDGIDLQNEAVLIEDNDPRLREILVLSLIMECHSAYIHRDYALGISDHVHIGLKGGPTAAQVAEEVSQFFETRKALHSKYYGKKKAL